MPALLMSKAKLLVLALGTWWTEDHVLESQEFHEDDRTIQYAMARQDVQIQPA
jgi:hypothetical protein